MGWDYVCEMQSPMGYLSTESHGEMILTETKELSKKTYPSATLYTINPKWTDPGLRSDRPATTRHGMALHWLISAVSLTDASLPRRLRSNA
jgi:hypothetical protein